MNKIKILGGGLSGLSAAINLLKMGYNVEIFEKRKDCGMRFLGDLQGLENWSSKIDVLKEFESMNLKINYRYKAFNEIVITDGKEIINNSSEKPFFYVVRRDSSDSSIDQGLKRQALDEGIKINFNTKMTKDKVNIISTGGETNKPMGAAIGFKFETDIDNIAVSLLNNKCSNRAYSYLLVDDGYGCICSVNLYKKGVNINKYLENTYKTLTELFDIRSKNKKKVGGLSCFLPYPRYYYNGIIQTGEASGFQDVFWGFGMRYAITSGYLAALSIGKKLDYKKLVKKELSPRLKTSIYNRFIADLIGDKYQKHLFNLAKGDDDWLGFLHWGYNPNVYSKFLYPLAKLRMAVNCYKLNKQN
jgi:flavin-dependent dehydrogenase